MKIKLTTLTPLYIGAGQEAIWSPYSDFIQVGEKLYLMDSKKLTKVVTEKGLLNKFTQQIYGTMNASGTRSEFNLRRFIEFELEENIEYFAQKILPVRGGEIKRATVRQCIKSGGRPFIPGSSIKGAIRTAILVDWLYKNSDSYLRKIREALNDRKFREIDLEQDCFGGISGDYLKYLQVSDSLLISHDSLEVTQVERWNLYREGSSTIPQWSEVISQGTCTTFTLKIKDSLGAIHDGDSLFGVLNKQALRIEKFENEALDLDFIPDTIFEPYDDICDNNSSNVGFLRLGGGKTYFDQSFGLWLRDKFPETDLNFMFKLLGLGKNGKVFVGKEKLDFPRTRSFVTQHAQPANLLGWVKLELIS